VRAALRSFVWDVIVAFFAAAAVFGVVFGLGRLSHPPAWLPSPGVVAAATDTGDVPDSGPTGGEADTAASIPVLQAIVDDMYGFGAAVSATGAIEDRLVFGDVDHFSLTPTLSCDDVTCTDGPPTAMSIAYIGDGIKLTIIASVPDGSGPFSDGVTPVLAAGAQSFIAHSGDCTMEFSSFKFGAPEGRFAQQRADVAGQMTCTDVADVRSGETVSYTAVFVLHTLEEVPP
jgi:hypothetical protein